MATKIASHDGGQRVVIEGVSPELDSGQFAIKRTIGESVTVECDAYADGHDVIVSVIRFRREADSQWSEVPMDPLVNDRWTGKFTVTDLGRYRYTIEAWVDRFRTWRRDLEKRSAAGQDIHVDLLIGSQLVQEAADRASGVDAGRLRERSAELSSHRSQSVRAAIALDAELLGWMDKYPDRTRATTYKYELPVVVDRERARFSSWYELFPRSCSPVPGEHGTFRDVENRLPYVAELGFDVLYLPPIHPIGMQFRKGRNNAVTAEEGDVGSPWAIGGKEGGHKAIHPQLGTLDDFHRLVDAARKLGIDIALDVAFQCSPDHPYVAEHPQWFRARPDGTIQYAENPPKKYQDIYPFDFETEDWRALWDELKSIFIYWINQGVRVFRVDNPHTKAFPFWEWCVAEVKRDYADVIFLAEAFTRPKVMQRLAKLGYTQSYTYFTWRNTKTELTQYFTELTKTTMREYFRPNAWPNTPDILPELLQTGGRPAFMSRYVLATTLAANYGIYGPMFEFCEGRPREHRSEEYLDSEKYEIRQWDPDRADSLSGLISRMNRIRRENWALQSDWSLEFHPIDNEQLICYSKRSEDGQNVILTVVNLDPYHVHAGWVDLPLDLLGLTPERPYQVHDLLSDARYMWHGARNFVQLDPNQMPAHVFRIRRWQRSEREFEYFM